MSKKKEIYTFNFLMYLILPHIYLRKSKKGIIILSHRVLSAKKYLKFYKLIDNKLTHFKHKVFLL